MKKSLGLSLTLSLGFVFTPTVHASAILFNYTTGNLGQGSGANSIVETVSGETVTATAWSLTGHSDTTFQTATLGQYSGYGLGVCNQIEVLNCSAPQHEIDDNGQKDFVLLTFSSPITSITITIDPVCDCDTNASYYVGNNLNPLGDTLAQLGTATNSNETQKDVTRTITLTGLGSGVNSVFFGASIAGTDNYFKIESISVVDPPAVAPEPATFAVAGAGLMALGVLRRKKAKARI